MSVMDSDTSNADWRKYRPAPDDLGAELLRALAVVAGGAKGPRAEQGDVLTQAPPDHVRRIGPQPATGHLGIDEVLVDVAEH